MQPAIPPSNSLADNGPQAKGGPKAAPAYHHHNDRCVPGLIPAIADGAEA